MIPIQLQPEPSDFDQKVRAKGLAWMARKRINIKKPKPKNIELEPYWRDCLPDLRAAYKSVCAYVCILVEEVTGHATVEHFVPSSQRPDLAYEWSNYRFVSGMMNGRKSNFKDVLDPFSMSEHTFFLDFLSGEIFVNPELPVRQKLRAEKTIQRLKLYDAACCRVRLKYWNKFVKGVIVESELQERSPFVWLEAKRQGWL